VHCEKVASIKNYDYSGKIGLVENIHVLILGIFPNSPLSFEEVILAYA
jgi:hypothetical protein